jgi:hypothetical protein
MPADESIMLRLGLTRGWDGPDKNWTPKRCFLQLNGVIGRNGLI